MLLLWQIERAVEVRSGLKQLIQIAPLYAKTVLKVA
jgi:hypothetical protein